MKKDKIKNVNSPAVVKKISVEYLPTKPIWLVFDMANGGASTRRYVWWFDTKKKANEWIEQHLTNNKHAYDVSQPVRWKPC